MSDSVRSAARFAAVLVFPLLAACGGDSAPPADSAATAVDSASSTAVAAPSATSPESATAGAAAGAGDVARGEAIYAVNCVSCHQATGQGVPGVFPPLAGSEWVTGPAERPIAIVMHGLQGPITVAGGQYNGMMIAYGVGTPLDDADLAAVVSYVRASWGNAAAPVSADDVARVRAATSGRSGALTVEDLQRQFP
jgi:mono/diheme cytochrome c family protein